MLQQSAQYFGPGSTTKSKANTKITIWLTRAEQPGDRDAFILNSASSKSTSYSDRLNFDAGENARKMLHPLLWEALQKPLQDAVMSGTFMDRQFAVEMPGVSLHHLSVCATKTASGLFSIMIIFKESVGTLARLFAPGRAPSSFEEAQSSIAANILEDVVLPTLDLCHIPIDVLKNASSEALEQRLTALMDKREDLSFYAALLTRFVAQQAELGARTDTEPKDIKLIAPANTAETPSDMHSYEETYIGSRFT